MKTGTFKNQEGFVALISVILISAILIILVVIISTSSFFTRFNVLEYENKKVSVALAEGCIDTAMVNLAKDRSYGSTIPAAGEQLDLGSGKTCKICSITGGGPYVLTSRAAFGAPGKAYTNLQVQGNFTSTNFVVTSWTEQATYAGSCTLP